MRTHVSADLVRFLIAGAANTALTSAIYFLGLLALTPSVAYAVAWLAGIAFVMWVYPDHVFVGARASLSRRMLLGATIVAVFLLGVAVLNAALSMTGRPDLAFAVALGTTMILNFALSRLLIRRKP